MNAQASALSPAQVNILDMMSFIKTPKALDELNGVLADYFAKRLDEEIDSLWEEGELTEEKVESFRKLHERTPYKQCIENNSLSTYRGNEHILLY